MGYPFNILLNIIYKVTLRKSLNSHKVVDQFHFDITMYYIYGAKDDLMPLKSILPS